MTIKEHLDNRLKLWHSLISELKGIHTFQQQERMIDPFYRRIFVNHLFSILDTYIHVVKELVKIKIIIDNDENNPVSWTEMAILHEKKVVLDSQGNIQVQDDLQEPVSLLRFTLHLFARVFQADQPLIATAILKSCNTWPKEKTRSRIPTRRPPSTSPTRK